MFRAPGQLPPISLLLDDIPTRSALLLARYLGIHPRTLQRYQSGPDTGTVPTMDTAPAARRVPASPLP